MLLSGYKHNSHHSCFSFFNKFMLVKIILTVESLQILLQIYISWDIFNTMGFIFFLSIAPGGPWILNDLQGMRYSFDDSHIDIRSQLLPKHF
jgi:hypothetical protein